jgi:hypothetical protein
MTDIAQFSLPALANQANRPAIRLPLLERVPPFNLIISNMPGPSVDHWDSTVQLLEFSSI